MKTTVLGIDPGLSGAVVALAEDEQSFDFTLDVFDTPVIQVIVAKKKRHDYVLTEMLAVLQQFKDARLAVLESLHPMPANGCIAAFSLGRGMALWEMALTAVQIPYVKVPPQRWQKFHGLGGTGRDKGASRLAAQRLFPAFANKFSRVKDDGRSDAALLALWGLRQGLAVAAQVKESAPEPQLAFPTV